MKIRFIILVLAFFVFQSEARAQYNAAKTDEWLAQNAPAMGGRVMLMIWRNGQVVYSHAVNAMSPRQKLIEKMLARRQGKKPDLEDYTASTRQPIASCSKWLSAALVMTFVDEGKLKLTDTIGKYLPVMSQHGKGAITISDCLSHLTGIKPPGLITDLKAMKNMTSMDEAVARIAEMPMEGAPGKVFHYSNVGLQLAGAVLEKISGERFQSLFAERIAAPLNMEHTDFGNARVALPAGGAVSTTSDYLNFLVMILNRGVYDGKRILSEKSITEMQINRITSDVKVAYKPGEAGDFGYGYGEWIMKEHAISSPGLFGSFPWVDYDKKYAAFMMTYYIKNTGRNERYLGLKKLVDNSFE